ncbi:MAG: hypothetical protein AAGB12_02125 [Pseudomonadota bacterium]
MPASLTLSIGVLLYILSFHSIAQSFINFEPIKTFYEAPTMTRFGTLAIDDRGHVCAAVKTQGLHCFDGVHIKTLREGYIASIVENNSTIMGATKEKVFTVSQGKFEFLPEKRQPQLETDEKIVQVLADTYSDLLILTNRGVYRLYKDSMKRVYRSDSESFYFVAPGESEESLWIASNEAFYLYNTTIQEKTIFFEGAIVYEMISDFYLTNNGIYDRDTNKLLFEREFFRSLRLGENDWLVAGHRGICRLKNLEYLNCHSSFVNYSDENTVAFSLLADQHGNIFAATNDGLYVSKPKFYQNLTQRHGLVSNRLTSLLAVDDGLYIGTNRGLNLMNMLTGEISMIPGTEQMPINSIEKVGDTLWLGVTWQGVYQLSLINGQINKIIDSDSRIHSITFIDETIYLAIQYQGIFKYDTAGNLLLSRKQKHFDEIRKIAFCNGYLFVSSTIDGLLKLNSELVIEAYASTNGLHTFICQDDAIIAGSRTGKLEILDFNLQIQSSYYLENPIYTILPYKTSFVAINEKGLYFGEKQRLVEMPTAAFLNVWNIYNNNLYFGTHRGLFGVDLLEAENFEMTAPILNLTLNDTGMGKSLSLRTSNIVKSRDYEWFLSLDNKNFTLSPDNDVFIPRDSQQSMFVYVKNSQGESSLVKKIILSEKFSFFNLDDRVLFFCIGMIFLAVIYTIFYYKNVFIFYYEECLQVFKRISFFKINDRSLYVHEEKDDEQAVLDIDVVRDLVSKIENRKNKSYHETRIIRFNQLLREKGKYLQGKEIAAAIELNEHQIRFSLRHLFGNGSLKVYTPIYLDIIRQQEGYDTK